MTQPVPARVTGVRCGAMVDAVAMSYPCSLAQGHEFAEEPHYAVEVDRSVRAWRAWNTKRLEAALASSSEFTDCAPACNPTLGHTRIGSGCVYSPKVSSHVGPSHPGYAEPTKQRAGDQGLPTGEGDCVQDLVIKAMQESKKVGLERYGSTLKTFNGRRGIQDVTEEVRDLFVYLTQIEIEADADRKELIEVVSAALPGLSHIFSGDTAEAVSREFATKAVDAIMGWVVGNRAG